jgi:flagellar biosynthesis component FlhA
MNPQTILAIIAIILVLTSYWPGAPTLPVAVICLAIALLVAAWR